ncbi:anti-sigma factor antagonist [Kutzneria sp. NPDC051319]|uniref:anti-sigma factor antagonist n=1 Tax=Kutzneria sp. NPDC051319 TaxID=3155047 RepID=UPI0034140315
MPAMPVTTPISVSTERIGTIAVVHLFGELDLATVEQVEQAVTAAAEDVSALILDLEGLSFLASTGLSLLARWSQRAEEESFGLRIVAARRQALRPLQITGLDSVLTIDATVDEALVALPRRAG